MRSDLGNRAAKIRNKSSRLAPAPEPPSRRFVASCVVLIVALGLLAYANSFQGRFVWDDESLIVNNSQVRGVRHVSDIGKFFTENIYKGAGRETSYFRPLFGLSLAMDHALWQLRPFGYHLTNVFLHILAALALFWFIQTLFSDKTLSLLAGVFFTLHPVQTEAVSYISGRSDPLALIFILLAFIFYLRQLRGPTALGYAVMGLAYAASLLSRESSLILPALVLTYHFVFKEKVRLKGFLPLVVISLLYVAARSAFLQGGPGASAESFLLRSPGFFAAMAGYVRLLLWPSGLHMEYGMRLFSWAQPQVLAGLLVVGVLLFLIHRQRDRNKIVSFSLAWFFVGLLPYSSIFPVNAYMAEHWLYVPSAGFFLLLAYYLRGLVENKKRVGVVVVAGLALVYAMLTIRQNHYWSEPGVFYERTLKYAPGSWRLLSNLSAYYMKKGQTQKAIALCQEAIEVNPRYADAYNNLGSIYAQTGRFEEAVAYFNKALEIDPDHIQALATLGALDQKKRSPEETVAIYRKAIAAHPGFSTPYYNLANFYLRERKYREAIPLYLKAIELHMDAPDAYNNLGLAYGASRQNEEAIAAYEKAIALDPGYTSAHANLGTAYNRAGRAQEAIAVLKKAIEVDPHFAMGYRNLSSIYYESGDYEAAVTYCDKAIEEGADIPQGVLKILEPYRKK